METKHYEMRNGGNVIITSDNTSSYRVLSGSVLVYLSCFDGSLHGRRLYLGEIHEGRAVPSVSYCDADGIKWYLVITTLDHATLSCDRNTTEYEACCDIFAEAIQLKNYVKLGLYEALAESYRLFLVKDDAFIYQTRKDNTMSYRESLQVILNSFSHSKEVDSTSSHHLYNCLATLCQKQHIPIKPLSEVLGVLENPTVCDIARISNFIVREITLDDQWYKKDVGCFLAFTRNDHQPVAVVTRGSRRYSIIDKENCRTEVTAEIAELLEDTGYALYRPLPCKPLTWLDVWRYVITQLRCADLLMYAAMMLIGTLFGLLLPEMNRLLFDRYIPSGELHGLLQVGMLLLAFSISNVLFSIMGGISLFRFSSYPSYSIEAALYHRLLNLPLSVVNSFDSGDLSSRVMGLGKLLCSAVNGAVRAVVTSVSALIYIWRMYTYSPQLSFMAVAILAGYVVVFLLLTHTRIRYLQSEVELRCDINSNLFQCLGGIAKIRMSGATNNALLRHIRKLSNLKSVSHQSNRISIYLDGISELLVIGATILFFCVIIKRQEMVSPGTYVAFSSSFGALTSVVVMLAELVSGFTQLKPILERSSFLVKNAPETIESSEMPGRLLGDIEISNVSFAYNQNDGNVLDNVNLHIKPGEYLAVVGPSGCGKSTLLKLILGFITPSVGKVYFDGRDVNKQNIRELRKQMGVVLQHGSLISGSVRENITITAPETSMERIQQVIDAVGLRRDIDAMPMGIHTMLNEEGENISGGQKQRILIARALANNPSILLFDEATSALDNVTQAQVIATLSKLSATRIVIAHRLSTVQQCDRIVVMNQGRIVEEGTYSSLMAKKGVFYQMAVRQLA